MSGRGFAGLTLPGSFVGGDPSVPRSITFAPGSFRIHDRKRGSMWMQGIVSSDGLWGLDMRDGVWNITHLPTGLLLLGPAWGPITSRELAEGLIRAMLCAWYWAWNDGKFGVAPHWARHDGINRGLLEEAAHRLGVRVPPFRRLPARY